MKWYCLKIKIIQENVFFFEKRIKCALLKIHPIYRVDQSLSNFEFLKVKKLIFSLKK